MAQGQSSIPEHRAEAGIAIWKEAFCGVDFLLLHATPAYYGLGVPRGDGSAVVLIPGFLTSDVFLGHLNLWLGRIGYRPYRSGIGLNAECPNLLIREHLSATIDEAVKQTGRRIHLIGHSLGGLIAHSVAVQRPDDIASVITLGSPVRGTVVHPGVWYAAERVREQILENRGPAVFSDCYTPRCTCDFSKSLRRKIHPSVAATAIYTRDDGIVDWRHCSTGDSKIDFEVPGTHLGLPFNASVYTIIGTRLAEVESQRSASLPVAVPRTRGKRPSRKANGAVGKRPTQNVRPALPSPIPVFDSPTLDSPEETSPLCTSGSVGEPSDRMPDFLPSLGREDNGGATLPSGTWSRFRRPWGILARKSRDAMSVATQRVRQGTHVAMLRLSTLVRKIRGA